MGRQINVREREPFVYHVNSEIMEVQWMNGMKYKQLGISGQWNRVIQAQA